SVYRLLSILLSCSFWPFHYSSKLDHLLVVLTLLWPSYFDTTYSTTILSHKTDSLVSRSLGDQDYENLPVLTTVTVEETTQVMVDYLDLNGSSSDGEDDEAAQGSPPDAALRRPARTPPSPQGRYPPQHQQKPAPCSGGPAGVVGGRRPSAPPAPRGRSPPHWVRSSDQQGPWLLDVFHRLLCALTGLTGQTGSMGYVEVWKTFRHVHLNEE
ncbi:Os01g0698800, partial [Oryza sativa Japonica Group]